MNAGKRLLPGWNRFFHEEASELSFAWFSAFFYLTVFFVAILSPLRSPLAIEPLFAKKILLFDLLHLPVASEAQVAALTYAWWAALLMSAFGLLGHGPRILAGALGLFVCGSRQNFGIAYHEEAALALSLVVMAFAPPVPICRVLRGRAPFPASGKFRWPVQLLRVLLAYIFFSAALLKLYFGGLDWLSQNIVFSNVNDPLSPMGSAVLLRWLAQHPALCRVLTLTTLALELFFPLTLVSRIAQRLLLPGGFMLLASIWAVFGYHFVFYMSPLFLAWLPWEALAPRLTKRPSGRVKSGNS